MIPKHAKRSYILDKLHRGCVMVLMGLTVVSGAALAYKGYIYFKYIRPALREMQVKNNEELLKEGKYTAAVS